MPTPPRKKAADQDIVSFIGEQISNDERTRHEREPLGFEDQMPGPIGVVPEDDPRFRPDIEAVERAAYRGLPRHEGYALDAAAHGRRRRTVFLAAGVFTVALAAGWLIALTAGITGGSGTPEAQAIAETRERLTEQFSRIGAALDRGAPTGTPATSASATASLQEAVAAIRAQLLTPTSTPR